MGGGSCLSSEGLLSSRPPHPAEQKGVRDQCFALVWDTTQLVPKTSIAIFVHSSCRSEVVQKTLSKKKLQTQTQLVPKTSIAIFVHSSCRSEVVQKNLSKKKLQTAHRHLWKKSACGAFLFKVMSQLQLRETRKDIA